MSAATALTLADVDVAEVERLAHWAANLGPRWARDEMRGEAVLRVLEALNSGTSVGLGRVAYRGAMQGLRQARYQAGGRRSRTALEMGGIVVGLVDPVLVAPLVHARSRDQRSWAGRFDDAPTATDKFGPILDQLVALLEERGVERRAVEDALVVLERAASRPLPAASGSSPGVGRKMLADVSASDMALQSGLSQPQCAALKTLLLGERRRSDRKQAEVPGLLARAHQGEDVWNDPRVQRMLDQIVNPGPPLHHPWRRLVAISAPEMKNLEPRLSASSER